MISPRRRLPTGRHVFKKGCEMKVRSSRACVNLAFYYALGEFVPKDLEKARKLYAIGCSDKYSLADEYGCEKLKQLLP